MIPELSRVVVVDRIPASFTVTASREECLAVAARLLIPGVQSLSCRFVLQRRGDVVAAQGHLSAQLVQSCVVSLEPVAQAVDEAFEVRFVPAGAERDDDDPEAPDELPYAGATIDLGEAAVEQLALALDPYPRRADAVLEDEAAGEAESSFGALRALRPDG